MGKKLFALALALLLCISTGVPAFAAGTGSISVQMKYDGAAVPGGNMTLCYVGKPQGARYVLTGGFTNAGISLDDLDANTAAALAAYAMDPSNSVTKTTRDIDIQGKVTFSGLESGLYLLYQEEPAAGYEPVNPFLVTIPFRGKYDVDATPKMGQPGKPDNPPPEEKTGGLVVEKEVTGQGDRNKDFSFTVTLSSTSINGTYGEMEFKNGVATFTLKHGESIWATGLPAGLGYTVTESGDAGYTVTSSNRTGTIPADNTAWVAFRNHIDSGDPGPEPGDTQLTVKKVWKLDDGGERAGSVTVALLKNGEQVETVILNTANGWTHTWDTLNDNYIWTVREVDVPEGFTATIDRNGMTFTITNDDKPDEPGSPEDPDKPDEPDDPGIPDEPDAPDEPDIPNEPDSPDQPDSPDSPDTPDEPRTGDPSLTSLWAGLCLLALGGMGLLTCQKYREKKAD